MYSQINRRTEGIAAAKVDESKRTKEQKKAFESHTTALDNADIVKRRAKIEEQVAEMRKGYFGSFGDRAGHTFGMETALMMKFILFWDVVFPMLIGMALFIAGAADYLAIARIHAGQYGACAAARAGGFKLNDYSNSFYSILSGVIAIETRGKSGDAAVFGLKAGEFFGEMVCDPVAAAQARPWLVRIACWSRRPALDAQIADSSKGVERKLDEVSLKRVVVSCLDTSLPGSELDYLVKQGAQAKLYTAGDTLFHEGDKGDSNTYG